jgi:hypothetical protein
MAIEPRSYAQKDLHHQKNDLKMICEMEKNVRSLSFHHSHLVCRSKKWLVFPILYIIVE